MDYYTDDKRLFPVPVHVVRKTAYGATIIESDYFYGQISIDDSVYNERVTPDYKLALSRIIPRLDKQIGELQETRRQMSEAIAAEGDCPKFGGGELRNVKKALPNRLQNLAVAVSLLAHLNAAEKAEVI